LTPSTGLTHGRVRVVGRLRVVDALIMPRVVTANLNAAVMMMAEYRQSLPAVVASSGGPMYRDLHRSGSTPVVGSKIGRR
jgi:GMC oxidoreductase